MKKNHEGWYGNQKRTGRWCLVRLIEYLGSRGKEDPRRTYNIEVARLLDNMIGKGPWTDLGPNLNLITEMGFSSKKRDIILHYKNKIRSLLLCIASLRLLGHCGLLFLLDSFTAILFFLIVMVLFLSVFFFGCIPGHSPTSYFQNWFQVLLNKKLFFFSFVSICYFSHLLHCYSGNLSSKGN